MALTDKLTAIANAIRAKTGKTDKMSLDQMVTEIGDISGGGGVEGVDEIYSDVMTVQYTGTTSQTIKTIYFTPEMKQKLDRAKVAFVSITNVDQTPRNNTLYHSFSMIPNMSETDEFVWQATSPSKYQIFRTQSTGVITYIAAAFLIWVNAFSRDRIVINGRCSKDYITDVSGTYNIRVYTIAK